MFFNMNRLYRGGLDLLSFYKLFFCRLGRRRVTLLPEPPDIRQEFLQKKVISELFLLKGSTPDIFPPKYFQRETRENACTFYKVACILTYLSLCEAYWTLKTQRPVGLHIRNDGVRGRLFIYPSNVPHD
jgi:hypothetical protein